MNISNLNVLACVIHPGAYHLYIEKDICYVHSIFSIFHFPIAGDSDVLPPKLNP